VGQDHALRFGCGAAGKNHQQWRILVDELLYGAAIVSRKRCPELLVHQETDRRSAVDLAQKYRLDWQFAVLELSALN
jgi:hypothetical protein